MTLLPTTLSLAGRAIAFREATVEDAPAIARTEVDSKRASIPSFVSEIELDHDARLERWVHYLNRTRSPRLAKDPRIVILASDGPAVVGYAACHETTKWGVAAELQSIYLLKEYQGGGIGTALFCLIVEWMERAGPRSLGVGIAAGNPYQRFYQKLGGAALDEHTYLWREWDRLAQRCAERALAISATGRVMPDTRMTFLGENPSPAQLERAFARNTRCWIERMTRAAGGEVCRAPGVTWVYTPGPGGETAVAFPQLPAARAGVQLDALMEYYRSRSPQKSVLCWSLLPPRPRDLGARLVARGFDWSWQPRWMWLELRRLRADHPRPAGLRVQPVEDAALWDVDDLPYYSRESAPHRQAAIRARPQRVWQFAAWLDGRVVGHATLNLTTGPQGVAGIFDVGVVPAARNQGIGKAVLIAACEQARSLGCRHALLNATGEPMYRQVGFETIGYGQTWFLNEEALRAPPPSPERVALAEAVGRGDLNWLDASAAGLQPAELDTPTPGGMRLIDLALAMKQPRAAEWLVRHGATLDVLSAWELGGAERVRQLLAEHPEQVDARPGGDGFTPLHVAVESGNTELVRVLLEAGADPAIQSHPAGGPLHVAGWFGRAEIASLLLERRPPLEATNQYGSTPLATTIRGASQNQGDHLGVVRSLLEAGAAADGVDGDGRPLRLAVELRQLDLVRALLEAGADPNRPGPNGETALALARKQGQPEIEDLLRRHGAKE